MRRRWFVRPVSASVLPRPKLAPAAPASLTPPSCPVLRQNLVLPEAAYTMGSDGKMSLGMGDFFVDLTELNLVLEI